MFRKETLWDSSPVSTHACRVPPARLPPTIDRSCAPRDGFNPAPFNYSQTPNERAALWLLGSRPLGESTNLFLEGFVHHRESAQQAAPELLYFEPHRSDTGGRVTGPSRRQLLQPLRSRPVVECSRRLVEAGNRRTEQEVDLWRALIGLEGSVAGWTWELALQSATSEATTVERGFVALSRLVPALGPSGPDDSGRIVCGPPDPATGRVPAASIIPGLRAAQSFRRGGQHHAGTVGVREPRALINPGTNEQRIAELVLSGPGGRMLGRDLQWVLGADYRREAGSLAPGSATCPGIPVDFAAHARQVSGALRREGAVCRNAGATAARSALGPGDCAEHRPCAGQTSPRSIRTRPGRQACAGSRPRN